MRLSVILTTLALLAVLSAGCDGNTQLTTSGSGVLAVNCQTLTGTVPAGSAVPLPVTVLVSRGGFPAIGEPVVFTASIGDVTADVVLSAADGHATAYFSAPASAGTALVTARVTTPGEEAFTTCQVAVTGTTNPRVSVSVASPVQLAGLTISVAFDGTVLTLSAPGAEAVGPLTHALTGCVAQVSSTITQATIVEACPTLRNVAGAEVARFTFANSGPVQDASNFQVTCVGVDESGFTVPTFCNVSVTQL